MSIHWIVLLIAVITEVLWALSLKAAQTNPGFLTIGSSVALTATNMVLLSYAMRGIPVGTAYAVWTGLGAIGVVAAGIVLYSDPMSLKRLLFMAVIIFGVVGLKVVSAEA